MFDGFFGIEKKNSEEKFVLTFNEDGDITISDNLLRSDPEYINLIREFVQQGCNYHYDLEKQVHTIEIRKD